MKVVNLRREKVLQKEKRTKQFKEDATKWYYWKDIETTKWFEENITNRLKWKDIETNTLQEAFYNVGENVVIFVLE